MGKIRLLKVVLILVTCASAAILFRGMPGRQSPSTKTPGISLTIHGRQAGMPAASSGITAETGDHEARLLAAALARNPGHTPVLFRIAKLESEDGRLQDAARHLREIVTREPENPEARLELGKVLFYLGDIQEAVEQTEEILKSRPDYEDALYNLGAIYGNLGNSDRAALYWKRLIALSTGSERAMQAQQMLNRLKVKNP